MQNVDFVETGFTSRTDFVVVRYPATVYGTTTSLVSKVRGTVSKLVTNGSKTSVMDVIGFICISLGSSVMTV
jgi:hypothetical protein